MKAPSLAGLLLAGSLVIGAQAPVGIPVEQEPKHKVAFKNDFEGRGGVGQEIDFLERTAPPLRGTPP